MLCLLAALLGRQQWVEPKFENVIPNGPVTAVVRKNDRYPLWDQDNTGKWRPFSPMCDEFRGKRLDWTKWADFSTTWHGRVPGWFDPDNVSLSSGRLTLTTRLRDAPADLAQQGYRTFSTAVVESVATVLYGAFEIRAKPMKSAASSSFWFFNVQPTTWTEIDIFELGAGAKDHERRDQMTVHIWRTPAIKEHHSVGGEWIYDHDFADDYHVYGFEWNPKEIRWYFDGVLVRRGQNLFWHQPLKMCFDSETMPEWFGLPNSKDLPSTFSIDYVRAWKPANLRQ
jgi:beta-glucanase (GH16 family)